MKMTFKKVIAVILVVAFSAAAAITGFAVSAASHSNPGTSSADKNTALSRPALADGVWQAVYPDGSSRLFFIDSKESAFSLIDPELGIGLPSRFDYFSETGIYRLQIGYEGNEESWRLIDNTGRNATVSDANGDLITLYYITNASFSDFSCYSLSELSNMAKAYFEAKNGSSDDIAINAEITTDGSFYAVITGTKNGGEIFRYTVDMITGTGTDSNYNKIDLSPYVPSE